MFLPVSDDTSLHEFPHFFIIPPVDRTTKALFLVQLFIREGRCKSFYNEDPKFALLVLPDLNSPHSWMQPPCFQEQLLQPRREIV